MLLEVKNLSVSYGAVKALREVCFNVDKGEIVAMIGPNGAGKSTALNSIAGVIEARDGHIENGQISFEGRNIKGSRTDQLVRIGISLVPEGRRVFPTMTVWENLEMGGYLSRDKSAVNHNMDKVFDLFPDLKQRSTQKAGTLSSGEQQMLAIGRAMMLNPSLLLLDEPSLGLSPNYVGLVFDKLEEINRNGTSILLVEQNAHIALEICHRGYVFEVGSITIKGDKESLLRNERIRKAYLG